MCYVYFREISIINSQRSTSHWRNMSKRRGAALEKVRQSRVVTGKRGLTTRVIILRLERHVTESSRGGLQRMLKRNRQVVNAWYKKKSPNQLLVNVSSVEGGIDEAVDDIVGIATTYLQLQNR